MYTTFTSHRQYPPLMTLFSLLFLLLILRASSGFRVNVTVDDQYGDPSTGQTPSYEPGGVWRQGSSCTGCSIRLDPNQTFDGTWHDVTWSVGNQPFTIEIEFTGVSVYVFFVLANMEPSITTRTDVDFILDGDKSGKKSYLHIPEDFTKIEYNVPVYVNENIENGPHKLLISTVGTEQTGSVLVLFDYLTYTIDISSVPLFTSTSDPSPALYTSSTISNKVIIHRSEIIGGSVAGGLILLALISSVIFYILKDARKARKSISSHSPIRMTSQFDHRLSEMDKVSYLRK